jgi:hypothetical protein
MTSAEGETPEAAPIEADEAPPAREGSRITDRDWIELALALILAIAAVGTAWAGFESSKWNGVQANSYAQASAARTESSRQSTQAGQLQTIDVISFTEWLNALNAEIIADPSKRPQGAYHPDPTMVSGFLFSRFRPEFRPAVMAWLDTHPLTNPQAPSTPFVMPQYKLAAQATANDLVRQAEQDAATARQANQRSDNYVLTAVLFALVLFFAALTGRIRGARPQMLMFGLSVAALLGAVITLATYPVNV